MAKLEKADPWARVLLQWPHVDSHSMIQPRCLRCRDPVEYCKCSDFSPLKLSTRVVVVMHRREAQKRSATGPFALTALANSLLYLYGQREQPLDLTALHEDGRRVLLLYPGENATPLTEELLRSPELPITLVVPDGSLRQTSRAARRRPGLSAATQVRLDGEESDTFTALARALGIVESSNVERELLSMFAESQERRRGLISPSPSSPADGAPKVSDTTPLGILHQDDALIFVNKPSGMLVHRGWGKDGTPALQVLRDQIGQRIFPVHRLDRATSGVLVFARSSEVARDLKDLFDSHRVTKRYLALCRGHAIQRMRIEHALAKEPDKPRVPAVTDVRLLGSFERYGLVEALPLTGRTHQIRRHLKHIAHPIIGDVRYGKGEHNRYFRERFGFHRLALHCESLTLQHPRTGATLCIHAPLPSDFRDLLRTMGLEERAHQRIQP